MKTFLLPLALVLAVAGNVAHFRFTRDSATAPLLERIARLEKNLEDGRLETSRIHSELATHRAYIRKLNAAREEAARAAACQSADTDTALPADGTYQPGLAELEEQAEIHRSQSFNFELRETNRLLQEISNAQPLRNTPAPTESLGEQHLRRLRDLHGR